MVSLAAVSRAAEEFAYRTRVLRVQRTSISYNMYPNVNASAKFTFKTLFKPTES